jgi:hypothetical protein
VALARVWEPGRTGADTDAVARPWLLPRREAGWDLLYAGFSGGVWRVCRSVADEAEPRSFRANGPPLEPGPAGSGEEGGVTSPCAMRTSDGGLLVVYAGLDAEGRRALFSAWAPSEDPAPGPGAPPTLAWQRLGPTLPAGQPGDADAAGCDHPSLARVGSRRWLWYTAHDGLGRGPRVAAASSVAGSPWQRHGVVLGHGAPGSPDADGSFAPGAIITPGGVIDVVYTGRSAEGLRIMRARSSDGLSFDRLGPATRPGPSEASLAVGPDGRAWVAAVVDSAISVWPSLT